MVCQWANTSVSCGPGTAAVFRVTRVRLLVYLDDVPCSQWATTELPIVSLFNLKPSEIFAPESITCTISKPKL